MAINVQMGMILGEAGDNWHPEQLVVALPDRGRLGTVVDASRLRSPTDLTASVLESEPRPCAMPPEEAYKSPSLRPRPPHISPSRHHVPCSCKACARAQTSPPRRLRASHKAAKGPPRTRPIIRSCLWRPPRGSRSTLCNCRSRLPLAPSDLLCDRRAALPRPARECPSLRTIEAYHLSLSIVSTTVCLMHQGRVLCVQTPIVRMQ